MRKFRTLKFVTRLIFPREKRGHRRRIFFSSLFEDLKEVKDNDGNYVSGYINYTDDSYKDACHELATDVPFYPFEERSYIDIGEFFAYRWPQPYYSVLKVRIIRISPLWKLLSGYGKYEVTIFGKDRSGNNLHYSYAKKVKL